MKPKISSHFRNLFEIENARNLNRQELVSTFVPTQSFWRVLSAKHHVVLGSRGSGKTALAKMLSHDHLSLLQESRAQKLVDSQDFIGLYVPTRLEWVGGLRNKPWQTNAEKELFFQWRMNLNVCAALLNTIDSCLKVYGGSKGAQARIEQALSMELSEAWGAGTNLRETITGLRRYLEDVEYAKHESVLYSRIHNAGNKIAPGAIFEADLFVPLRRGITLATRALALKETCVWLVCLDEAEFLDEFHHRILNSHMRAHSGNIFFKVTTMPFCHYTLDTNIGVSLDVGHDFEYIYIDSDPTFFERATGEVSSIGTKFARTIFNKRVEASGLIVHRRMRNEDKPASGDAPEVSAPHEISGENEPETEETLPQPNSSDYIVVGTTLSINDLLGFSPLLDSKNDDWTEQSPELALLYAYCSVDTKLRAHSLLGKPSFKPEISRKIHGALLLRDAYEKLKGNSAPSIYSGATLAMRCGDANPRRVIRIFNAMVLAAWSKLNKRVVRFPALPEQEQTRIMRSLSNSALVRVQSEPKCGPELYNFLKMLGDYMHGYFHKRPLTTDQISSIIVDESIDEKHWILVQRAVELGLLYPQVSKNSREETPARDGTYHLAFILSPRFFLLPRRGQPRHLSTILKDVDTLAKSGEVRPDPQLELF